MLTCTTVHVTCIIVHVNMLTCITVHVNMYNSTYEHI